MITKKPYGTYCIIKPGRLPEPLKAAHTCDPPEFVEMCLRCTLPDCRPKDRECALYGSGAAGKQKSGLRPGDLRIYDMIRVGWRDEPLCREIGISADELRAAKRRLKRYGKIG